MEVMICPKSRTLVDANVCVALKGLSKAQAEIFSRKICLSTVGCPKEDYVAIFNAGWSAVGEFIKTIEE